MKYAGRLASATIASCRQDVMWFSAVSSELDKLTPREREILDCLARGESNKSIARNLELAESTVKIHVQNVLKKLKLSSRVQAAVYAVEHRMQGGA